MLNKLRLQTNNESLQALITKANSLPNVNGGDGGGIETCTVTLVGNSPGMGFETIWWVDETLTLRDCGMPTLLDDDVNITVVKNSILCSNCMLGTDGNISRIIGDGTTDAQYAFFVTGNGSIIEEGNT